MAPGTEPEDRQKSKSGVEEHEKEQLVIALAVCATAGNAACLFPKKARVFLEKNF